MLLTGQLFFLIYFDTNILFLNQSETTNFATESKNSKTQDLQETENSFLAIQREIEILEET